MAKKLKETYIHTSKVVLSAAVAAQKRSVLSFDCNITTVHLHVQHGVFFPFEIPNVSINPEEKYNHGVYFYGFFGLELV